MNEDRISKHIEFTQSLDAYSNYLSKLKMDDKKKLDNLNNKSLWEKIISLGFLDKIVLNAKIKKRKKT